MASLRYPDVFAAAASSSAVTDWRAYSALYAERHLGLLPADPDAYRRASVLALAGLPHGRLLLYYGTRDDNVHPSHTSRLLDALRRAGTGVDLRVGVDRSHSSVDEEWLLEFFADALSLPVVPRP
jgi:dipeptidyl-peptidase-4